MTGMQLREDKLKRKGEGRRGGNGTAPGKINQAEDEKDEISTYAQAHKGTKELPVTKKMNGLFKIRPLML